MATGMTGPPECRCGEQWTIQKIKLPGGQVFRNYWCRYCDTIKDPKAST